MADGSGLAALGLGLAASLSWGTSDFNGGLAAKRAPLVVVMTLTYSVGLALVVAAALISAEPVAAPADIAWAGVALFAVAVLFTLITLPVELDASKRAKGLLTSSGILIGDEMEGVNKVLNAAALTYVAAAVAAIGQLLYYVMLLSGGRRR